MKLLIQLFRTFFKIGAFSFGGGYAMVSLLEKEIVTKKGWLKKEELVDVLTVAQSAPGAIAVNCATAVGFKIAGKKGALFSTLGVSLPSFLIITCIASYFTKFRDLSIVKNAFNGISASVVALIITAAISVSKTAIKDKMDMVIAIITFVVIVFFKVNPIFAIIGGLLFGCVLYVLKLDKKFT